MGTKAKLNACTGIQNMQSAKKTRGTLLNTSDFIHLKASKKVNSRFFDCKQYSIPAIVPKNKTSNGGVKINWSKKIFFKTIRLEGPREQAGNLFPNHWYHLWYIGAMTTVPQIANFFTEVKSYFITVDVFSFFELFNSLERVCWENSALPYKRPYAKQFIFIGCVWNIFFNLMKKRRFRLPRLPRPRKTCCK